MQICMQYYYLVAYVFICIQTVPKFKKLLSYCNHLVADKKATNKFNLVHTFLSLKNVIHLFICVLHEIEAKRQFFNFLICNCDILPESVE